MAKPTRRNQPRKVKPLPPLMAKAFASLADALDMSKPANLGDQFPFFVKGVDQIPEIGKSGPPDALPCVICRVTFVSEGLEQKSTIGASRPYIPSPDEIRREIKTLVAHTPRGAVGVAELLGIPAGTLRPFLNKSKEAYPRNVVKAWLAYKRLTPVCGQCGQSISKPTSAITQPAAAPAPTAPNPANLDSTGKRYVLAGCMVELPDLAMAKVGRVDNGRWYLPTDPEPHRATCNQVRVLMRTYSESMGAFYWA